MFVGFFGNLAILNKFEQGKVYIDERKYMIFVCYFVKCIVYHVCISQAITKFCFMVLLHTENTT